jgi:long-chain acyl-CoA synthetase
MQGLNGPGDILPWAAQRFGRKLALVTATRKLTFTDLNDISSALAASLRRRGVTSGERISICAPNRWEWIVAYHAILKAGAVVNPLSAMLTDDEIAYATADCGASAIFCESARAANLVALARGAGSTLRDVIAFDDGGHPGAVALSSLLRPNESEPGEPFRPNPTDVSTIGYTSGTTGRQKGAMQSHRSVLLNCALTATMHGRSDRDTVVTALPAPHVYGNVAINGTLLTGGTVVLMARFAAAEALELIGEHQATLFEGVPTMYAMMLAAPEIARARLSTLTRSTVGGQTIAIALEREWEGRSGAPLLELWGMTELAGLGTTHSYLAPNVHGSVGVSLPGVALRIASFADQRKTAPHGEAGELCVRGPLTMLGYYGKPEATAEVLDAAGWLHTGDVAYMQESGHVFVVDRLKDTIITGGYNVYPAEIERVIAAHPAVAMVGVGRVLDDMKGELAAAYVVLREGMTLSAEEVVEHCRPSLAAYKLPRLVRFVDDLPKTSSGKIMRRELGRAEPARSLAGGAEVART